MARQIADLPVTGSIGDVTYYRSKNGKFARRKVQGDKNRFATDPKLAKLRAHTVDLRGSLHAGVADNQ